MKNISAILADFPLLKQTPHGKRLAYLDNGATTLKPNIVIDTVSHHYRAESANIHRGVHHLSEVATQKYENARKTIASFIGAASTHEVIFTSGTTQSINTLALSLSESHLKEGDIVIISHMEHHSNIVPWQLLKEKKGIILKVIPINDKGELDMATFNRELSNKVKLVSMVYVSNSLGTINPVKEIIQKAHTVGALVHLDGAQALSHLAVDVQALDVDFLSFSGHKLFGPTGIGIFYGKEALLEKLPPVYGGGDMIKSVTFEKTLFNDLPYKFEAGTPNIAGAIGLGAAISYITELGFDTIQALEKEVFLYARKELSKVEGLKLIGTAEDICSICSFVLGDIHPHDIGSILDTEGIAIRTGHHCTQPVMDRFGIPATARASLSFYNTKEDINQLINGLQKVKEIFS